MISERYSTLGKLSNRALFVIAVVLAVALFGCFGQATNAVSLSEASGIFYDRDTIWIVGDDAPGTVFIYPLKNVPASGVIPIDTSRLTEWRIPGTEFVSDLESLDRLADGRLVLLSEDLHALCAVAGSQDSARCSIVSQYDQTVTELGNRGLESVAVKPLAGGGSLVAVAWEGGYPEFESIPPQLRELIGHTALEPVVIIDTIPALGTAGYIGSPAVEFQLTTPKDSLPAPLAQRFRISDLVWHTGRSDSGDVDELIALLSSANSPLRDSGEKRRFQNKWLVRFDLSGHAVGIPVDITPLVKLQWARFAESELPSLNEPLRSHALAFAERVNQANWENVNWEGLAWFRPNESLILIYDGNPLDPPIAFIIPLPAEWR